MDIEGYSHYTYDSLRFEEYMNDLILAGYSVNMITKGIYKCQKHRYIVTFGGHIHVDYEEDPQDPSLPVLTTSGLRFFNYNNVPDIDIIKIMTQLPDNGTLEDLIIRVENYKNNKAINELEG